ncbi:carboxypeptidase regulatory-like domain-containing protein [candidate division KSB1 bacterium]|nr:carboxypeptidase regulatory-like domain-containing protein [candidate division KSB1 bacterium]
MRQFTWAFLVIVSVVFTGQAAIDGTQRVDHMQYMYSVASSGPSVTGENCEGGISGVMTDIDLTSPDIRAYVVAYPADSSLDNGQEPSKGFSVVEDDGSFLIEGLCEGYYYVMAEAAGYEIMYYENSIDMIGAQTVYVNGEDVTEGIDFKMQQIVPGTSNLSGTVVCAADQQPIPDAAVFIFSNENPRLNKWTSTGPDGRYRFDGLKSGVCYVRAVAEGYIEQYYDHSELFEDADAIEIVEPDSAENINFELQVGGSISGRIVDQEGHPVPDVHLYAMQFGFDSLYVVDPDMKPVFIGEYGKAISDKDGYYTMTGLSTGEYLILAEVWNQWYGISVWYENARDPQEATPVSVITGQDTPDINFQISIDIPNGEIVGHVWDTNGNPVQEAYVTIQSYESYDRVDYVWISVVTDMEGYYHVRGLPEGQYLVSVLVENGWQSVFRWWPDAETIEGAEPIVIDDSDTLVTADFRIVVSIGKSSISGIVVDENENPITGASVRVTTSQQQVNEGNVRNQVWAYAVTDDSGYYCVEKLPQGIYFAEASFWSNDSVGQQWYDHAEDMESATVIELGEAEKRENVSFTLTVRPVYGSIVGTVLDSISGAPVKRAFVKVQPAFYDQNTYMRPYFYWSNGAITDENGRYSVDWLFEGSYTVAVYADNVLEYYEHAASLDDALPVQVVGGEKTAIDYNLVPRYDGPGIISGKVLQVSDGQPYDLAVVTAIPVDSQTMLPVSKDNYISITAENGDYTLEGLPVGDYIVSAFSRWGIEEYYQGMYDPSQAEIITVNDKTPVSGINFNLAEIWPCGYDDYREGKTNSVSIIGNISNENAEGIEGAVVYIFSETGVPIASTRTDAEGNYEFAGLVPGSYIIQAGSPGFITLFNGNAHSMDQVTPVQIGNGLYEFNFILPSQSGSNVPGNDSKQPDRIQLYQNYPNPFNPVTTIAFDLPEVQNVKLVIYNVTGKAIRVLYDGTAGAGRHELVWDSRNEGGQNVSSGVYFGKLETDNGVVVRKMILMR